MAGPRGAFGPDHTATDNDLTQVQAELILKAKDLNRIVQLIWVSRSWWIRFYAVSFILLNIASPPVAKYSQSTDGYLQVSQIALATLGLTYSTNPADSFAILKPGNVTIPDLSDLDTERVLSSSSQGLSALRYTANRYEPQCPSLACTNISLATAL